jgi:nucleoside-diphosphate-sugar epimerase
LIRRLKALGMRRLIAFSSTSRLTKGDSDEAAERDVVAALIEGEATVARACDAAGVAWTILRPTLIYDEGRDENVSRIARIIRKLGVFPLYGAASGLRQPVHARDLAAAAARALRSEASHGKTYNLPGGETLTYREMVARIAKALRRPALLLAAPEGLWRFGFAVLSAVRRRPLKNNLQMARRMNVDLCFDEGEAARDFGYKPRPFTPDFNGEAS